MAGGSLEGVGYHDGPYYGTYNNGWFDSEQNSKSSSATAGLQLGYNYQLGLFVVGLETDLNYVNAEKSYITSYSEDLYPYPDTRPDYNYHLREKLRATTSVDWFGTLRVRLGMTPIDRLLVYATGGAAYGQVAGSAGYGWHEYGFWWGIGDHFFDRTGGFAGSSSSVRWGWTLGAGAEYAITDHVTIKGEYLYVDLGSQDYIIPASPMGTESITWKSNTQLNILRLGMNYKF